MTTTINDLLKKFNIQLTLTENTLNYDIEEDLGLILDDFKEFFTEKSDESELYVFRGEIGDEDKIYFEYIINSYDESQDGPTTTYFGYPDKKYETARAYSQRVFNKDGSVTKILR